MTTPSDDAEPVGSVAEEAFKLFRAVTAAPHADPSATSDEQAPTGHVCTTSWCPVCQVVGFVRDNPEMIAAVTHSASGLVRSLRDVVDAALAPQQEEPQ